MRKIFFVAIVTICAVGCCNQAKIEGAWGEKSPCPDKKVQGIVLEEGGIAKSIHLKGICFESWKQEGDLLILAGKRMPCPSHCKPMPQEPQEGTPCPKEGKPMCKKQCKDTMMAPPAFNPDSMPMSEPIAFSDTLKIKKLTADSLILVAPCGHVFNYARLCDKDQCCGGKDQCCEKGCKDKCAKDKCCKEKGEQKGDCPAQCAKDKEVSMDK